MESKNFDEISIDIPNYSGPLEVLLDLVDFFVLEVFFVTTVFFPN